MTDMLWYAGRGTGVVTLVLLSIVVALGIAARGGRPAFGLPRFVVNLLHRNAALLAVILLVVHVGTLYFDPYAQLELVDLVVPFGGEYRPFWLGLGTLGLDVLVAVVVTSLLRHRIGLRGWRVVHWLAYLSWPLAMLHGIQTGTDSGTWWMWTVVVVSTVMVIAAVAWRLSPSFGKSAGKGGGKGAGMGAGRDVGRTRGRATVREGAVMRRDGDVGLGFEGR